MKNKYAPYILAPILILVWGTIFYKIYQAMQGEDYEFTPPPVRSLPLVNDSSQTQSFALLLDYKDPFLGKEFAAIQTTENNSNYTPSTSKTSNNNPNNSQNIRQQPNNPNPNANNPKITIKFPNIIYQGYQIVEQDTVALLKIEEQFIANAREGQQLGTVRLEKIYPDSIRISYQGHSKAISRLIF